VPAIEVWAFGSRVGGQVKPYSDLDLAIINEAPLSLQLLGRLKDAFSESNLPYRVDIIDWASTDDAFRSVIAAKKTVILSR
jgi:predicted nucleotidyltransferase